MVGRQHQAGTRFRLYPQAPFLRPGRAPEIVYVARPPGAIGPGPSDDRIVVIDPVGKRRPYGVSRGPFGTPHLYLPPWHGPLLDPVVPGPDGHFDHVPVDTPEFQVVHAYGALRFVLDVWEGYLGHRIPWHFERHFRRLEVSILPGFGNAHVGYGFMEIGEHRHRDGSLVPFALNFDIVAHEFGHLVIYGIVGVPVKQTESGEYFGFHESAADMTALIAALHFQSVIDDLLDDTAGNLYAANELNRFAELSATTQIRMASNSVTLDAFARGWNDEHTLSQPLTGALFDVLVDLFQENLVDRGLIGRDIADLGRHVETNPAAAPRVQAAFDEAYGRGYRAGFGAALMAARDYLGRLLAACWQRLDPHHFSYAEVAERLLALDRQISGGRHGRAIFESFAWRGIGRVAVGPRLSPPDEDSHSFSARTVVPADRQRLPRMRFSERMALARQI